MKTKTQTARITKRVVDSIAPPPSGEAPAEVWDADLRGLHVRVPASGRAVYRLWYRVNGRQKVVTLGAHGAVTPEEARQRARTLLGAVAEGRDPVAERKAAEEAARDQARRAITVGELIDRYLSEGPALNPAKRARSWAHDRTCLESHVRPLIGNVLLANVRRGDVEGIMTAVLQGKTARRKKLGPRAVQNVKGGPAAARAAVVATQTLFQWAIQRELMESNPARGVKKPPPGKREIFLSDEQVERLLKVISDMETDGRLAPVFGDTLRLLALTGARRSEVERLRWSEVDFQRGVVMLPDLRSKTGRKTMPLGDPALAILAQRQRIAGSDFVFPGIKRADRPANALSKNWQRVRAAAGLPAVRVHDLRHTLASFLVARGATLPMIGGVLGHKSSQTTARYAHLQADPLRALVDGATARFAVSGAGASLDTSEAQIIRLKRPNGT
jgi:integrase